MIESMERRVFMFRNKFELFLNWALILLVCLIIFAPLVSASTRSANKPTGKIQELVNVINHYKDTTVTKKINR
jgi:hypothetical protein